MEIYVQEWVVQFTFFLVHWFWVRGSCPIYKSAEATVAEEEAVTYASTETAQAQRAQRAARNTRIHKVRKGETLSSIAKKRHTTVAKLCRANGISTRTKLRVGQILKYS